MTCAGGDEPARPPRWLRDRLARVFDDIGRYPGAAHDLEARRAVAARYGRDPDEVLVLAGAAEGLALLPVLGPRHAAVLRPGCDTAADVLTGAGVPVSSIRNRGSDGHGLRAGLVAADVDLLVVANPAAPGLALDAAALRVLAAPGRVLVVEESDAGGTPDGPVSLASVSDLGGLLVLRDLSVGWALAGLRAGYALGEPELLARLAARRPQWPVGTLAVEAVIACCEPAAVEPLTPDADRSAAGQEVS